MGPIDHLSLEILNVPSNSNIRNKLPGLWVLPCDPSHERILCALHIVIPLGVVIHVLFSQCIVAHYVCEFPLMIVALHIVFLRAHELPPNIFLSRIAIIHRCEPLPVTFASPIVPRHVFEIHPMTFVSPSTLLLIFEPPEVIFDSRDATPHMICSSNTLYASHKNCG
jgi:hypothetical protein